MMSSKRAMRMGTKSEKVRASSEYKIMKKPKNNTKLSKMIYSKQFNK